MGCSEMHISEGRGRKRDGGRGIWIYPWGDWPPLPTEEDRGTASKNCIPFPHWLASWSRLSTGRRKEERGQEGSREGQEARSGAHARTAIAVIQQLASYCLFSSMQRASSNPFDWAGSFPFSHPPSFLNGSASHSIQVSNSSSSACSKTWFQSVGTNLLLQGSRRGREST
jgi:hypothetical protein